MFRSIAFLIAALILLASSQDSCLLNTVSIIGAGQVKVNPDTATFIITVNGEGLNSAQALSNVNTIIAKVTSILKANGIPSANYSTSSISLNPNYNYSSGNAVLVDQAASQSLTVTIGSLSSSQTLLGNLLTSLGNVNNITIGSLTFLNGNTDSAYSQARQAAFQDAQNKANQYANLSGIKLGSISKIVDQNTDNYVPYSIPPVQYQAQALTIQIPYGKVQVSATVEVDWSFSP
ncbi:unnamed protein product [Sphagnum balticum]